MDHAVCPYFLVPYSHANKGKRKTPTVHSLHASDFYNSPAFTILFFTGDASLQNMSAFLRPKPFFKSQNTSPKPKRVSENYANRETIARCAEHTEQDERHERTTRTPSDGKLSSRWRWYHRGFGKKRSVSLILDAACATCQGLGLYARLRDGWTLASSQVKRRDAEFLTMPSSAPPTPLPQSPTCIKEADTFPILALPGPLSQTKQETGE